jgi:nitrogen fixation/metabolism regulation signal transduction histidine kinase
MNLIDNAIYWLENKGASNRQIYLGTTNELDDKPSIVIADNGPGFIDPPEYVIEPFFSRKPDGMGLGLHIANEVMKIHKGRLLFPEAADLSLPKQFTGAIVALQFPEAK